MVSTTRPNVFVVPEGSSQAVEVYTAHGFGSTSHRMNAPPGRYHILAFGGGQITLKVDLPVDGGFILGMTG